MAQKLPGRRDTSWHGHSYSAVVSLACQEDSEGSTRILESDKNERWSHQRDQRQEHRVALTLLVPRPCIKPVTRCWCKPGQDLAQASLMRNTAMQEHTLLRWSRPGMRTWS